MALVFKTHPSWPKDFSHLTHREQNIYFANNNDTQQLIEKANAVITINSTVGIESLLLDTQVITLGNACYKIDALVTHACNSSELVAAFSNLANWQPDETLRTGFLNYLKIIYTLPQRWSAADDAQLLAATERLTFQDEYCAIYKTEITISSCH